MNSFESQARPGPDAGPKNEARAGPRPGPTCKKPGPSSNSDLNSDGKRFVLEYLFLSTNVYTAQFTTKF